MTKRQQLNLTQSQDAGYTIIESIVAMVVVSVLMIAIAPVMAFSVATRVQAKRVEMATQAARTYIDALRSGALIPVSSTFLTPGFPKPSTSNNKLQENVAPANITDNLYCIDNDGGGCNDPSSNQDLLVQGHYFNNGAPNPERTGYSLIVRVYRAGSFAGGVGALKTQNELQAQQGISSAGLGNLRAPLVEIRTEIGGTDRQGAYRSFCDRDLLGCKD
jgi:prepilin-type N-terminal cleavage/methylation domain-containing protein